MIDLNSYFAKLDENKIYTVNCNGEFIELIQ